MKKENMLKSYQFYEQVERTVVRGGQKLLLYLSFYIYLVREILFLPGESQRKVREF